MRGLLWVCLLAATALGCGKPVPDGLPALTANRKALDPSLASGAMGVAALGATIGWEFTVSEPIVVTHLGLFDYALEGLVSEHSIGIYRAKPF